MANIHSCLQELPPLQGFYFPHRKHQNVMAACHSGCMDLWAVMDCAVSP